ncbi:DUF2157 domain-containing protein [Roseateles sp.]|uniref:DUF2157 domain-containing protein n=1 Tax=Roseateles sp. TaxID=1971397 RepID=UPI0025DB1B6D|nr:DUF2157 domain-containing protein [Roseateles sp.]MBV8035939.1 DUF2157 domain-containing protein [Roseateles sp.]
MDWHAVVADGVREHGLSEAQRRELLALGGVGVEPPVLLAQLPLMLIGLAALLAGLGLVFAVAANWDELSRVAQFGLLQAAVALGALGVIARPGLRMPLGLWCLLAMGGLLAFFGQTYQTGADAWQLFALWAALGLPLALGVRADTVWSAWALVAMTAISLWMTAHTRHAWRAEPDGLAVHLIGWVVALLLVLALGSRPGHRAGAGLWARRTAACLAVLLVTASAVAALFGGSPTTYVPLALLTLGAAAWVASRPAAFELFTLSAAALGLNAVLVGGLGRWLFDGHGRGDGTGQWLLIGLVAAALLSGTVSAVLRLARAAERQGVDA